MLEPDEHARTKMAGTGVKPACPGPTTLAGSGPPGAPVASPWPIGPIRRYAGQVGGGLEQADGPAGTPLAILVVDDEPAIRDVFSRFLARRGHRVVTCGTAGEGIAAAEQARFDVIVTDLLLPDLSGLEMARRLRANGCTSRLVVLTGEPGADTVDQARELSVFRYLAKPIRAGVLIDVIEEAGKQAG